MGRDELAELHGRMDPILKKLGYTKGSVGDRMNALAKDPRYKFPDNDTGRAEIVAYIQTWLGKIRAELPRAFRTLVKGNVEVKRLPLAEEPGAPCGLWRRGIDRRQHPGQILDQPAHHRIAQQIFAARPRRCTRRSRGMSGRANMRTRCR